jgi:hypothetical protein
MFSFDGHCWSCDWFSWHYVTTTSYTVRYVPVVSGFWSFLPYDI